MIATWNEIEKKIHPILNYPLQTHLITKFSKEKGLYVQVQVVSYNFYSIKSQKNYPELYPKSSLKLFCSKIL